MTVVVPLTRGKVAMIDDEDADRVLTFKWYAYPDSRRQRIWYAQRHLPSPQRGKFISMHRFILNAPPGVDVDHVNGDTLDNQRSNLRWANDSQNAANRRYLPTNTSGFRGVCFNKKAGKWQAGIKHQGKSIYLGIYDDVEAAARAYDAMARRVFGEFAVFNFAFEVPA